MIVWIFQKKIGTSAGVHIPIIPVIRKNQRHKTSRPVIKIVNIVLLKAYVIHILRFSNVPLQTLIKEDCNLQKSLLPLFYISQELKIFLLKSWELE